MKKKDILQKKESELVALRAQSDSALSLVRSTINGLEATNTQIAERMEEIAAMQERLDNTKAGLADTYNKNQKIMQNFKNLLCLD